MANRDQARRLIRTARLPMPLAERNLHITGLPKEWPEEELFRVGQHVLRAALENGCTHVVLHLGVHTRRRLDLMDLLQYTAQDLGYVPRPPKGAIVTSRIATDTFLKTKGAELDKKRVGVSLYQPVCGASR